MMIRLLDLETARWGRLLRCLALGIALAGIGLAPAAYAQSSEGNESPEVVEETDQTQDQDSGDVENTEVTTEAEVTENTEVNPNASKSLLDPGQVVVTGFSGSLLSDSEAAAGNDATKVDETFVNVDGAVARVVDISGVSPGNTVTDNRAAEAFEITARDIGQVFGIALDRSTNPDTGKPAPNIYLSATSAYGLHIVVPDRDGDGWPKRVTTGDPEADWMEGLFGTAKGGGPGTIWKIDGVTGEVSKFADITDKGEANSGASLGNISYDIEHDLLYVSDMETGHIYRLNMQGEVLDRFDHGVEGREAEGLPAFEDDPSDRADTASPQFKSDDPATWGYAQPSRRVWGLKVFAGRLYYAVAEGPEIWSIALGAEGEFDGARREIALPVDIEPYEIADVSFTSDGIMILAQRPPVTGAYDYVTAVATGPARVMRYKPGPSDTERWVAVPDEYSIGERGEYRNTSGGVALGYAFKEEGGLDYGRCEQTLWTTGESLLQEQTRAIKVEKVPGFATSAIDGLQGNSIEGIREGDSAPPEDARYVDYDGAYVDNGSRGHLGDVEIPYHCAGDAADAGETWTPEYEVAWWSGDYASDGGVYKELDISVTKRAVGNCKPGGICRWEITFANEGETVYYGPAVLTDTLSTEAMALVSAGPAPWGCAQYGASLNCHRPAVYLKPGRHLTLSLSFRLSSSYGKPTIRNCAKTNWLAGGNEKDIVRAVQMELALRKYYAGEVDGAAGPQTVDAIETFEADAGMNPTGEITKELIIALFGRGGYRGGDANPDNDEGCAEHAVDGAYKPRKIYEPKLVAAAPYIPPVYYPKSIVCEPGYSARGGDCVRICPPGTWRSGNRCIYEQPEIDVVVCYGGRVPTFDGDCACPIGMNEVYTGYRTRCVWPERIRCYGGRIIDGDCFCPEGTEAAKTGRRSYVCLPIRDFTCIDGTWRNGRCDCSLNRYLIKLDSSTYQCVRRSNEPTCYGGYADDGRCYCPDRTDPVRLAPGVYQCARKDNDRLTCIGGYASGGACYCNRDYYHPVRLSRRVYECRRRGGHGDDLTCINGRSRDGACYCRGDDKLVKVSSRIYRCEGGGGGGGVVCRGGDVVSGRCVCPEGTRRSAIGDNAYQCTKTGGSTNVTCLGGQASGNKCACPADSVPVKFGQNAYRCKLRNTGGQDIVCKGGTYNGSRCSCPSGSRAVMVSRTYYRCVTREGNDVGGSQQQGGSTSGGTTTRIGCAGGEVDGNTCVCPQGTTRQRLAANRFRCVPKAGGGGNNTTTRITCVGGKLDGRTCICPSGTKRVQTDTGYRCFGAASGGTTQDGSTGGGTTTPRIGCAGGEVDGNTCVCPPNSTRQKVAANRFRCVPKKASGNDGGDAPQAKIVCQGGDAQAKRCVCPQGSRAQQTGANAYRCVTKGGDDAQQKKQNDESEQAKVKKRQQQLEEAQKQQQQQKKQQQQQKKKQQEQSEQQQAKKRQQQQEQLQKQQQQQKKKQQQQDQSEQQKVKKRQQQLEQLQKQQQQQQKKKQQQQQQQKKKQQQQQDGQQQGGGNQQKKKANQQGGGVQCIGGRPAGNRCACPQGQRAVPAGPKTFICQPKGG